MCLGTVKVRGNEQIQTKLLEREARGTSHNARDTLSFSQTAAQVCQNIAGPNAHAGSLLPTKLGTAKKKASLPWLDIVLPPTRQYAQITVLAVGLNRQKLRALRRREDNYGLRLEEPIIHSPTASASS